MALTVLAGEAKAKEKYIDEVVVTAERKESLKHLHTGNIAVLNAPQMRFHQPTHAAHLLNTLPGVFIQKGSGQEQIVSMRSPLLTGGAGAGSFLFLEDGLPLRATGFANINGMFEAMPELSERLEVIRGPAGALYGSGALHGLINTISAQPTLKKQRQISLRLGQGGEVQTIGSYSGPLAGEKPEVRAFKIAMAVTHEEGGERASAGSSQQKLQIRTTTAKGDTTISHHVALHNLNQETAGYVLGVAAYKDTTLRAGNLNGEAFRDSRALRYHRRWEHTISDSRHVVVTPFFRYTSMKFLMHFLPSTPVEKNSHASLGMQGSYHVEISGKHRIISGVFAELTHGTLKQTQTKPTQVNRFTQEVDFPFGVHYHYRIHAGTLAYFIQSLWAMNTTTNATVGLRLETTRYSYDNKTTSGTFGRFLRPESRHDTYTNLAPKIGITTIVTPRIMMFVNLARGHRAPQTTDLYRIQARQVEAAAQSEILDSLEMGVRQKATPLHGMEWEWTVFFMKKKNGFFRDADGYNVVNSQSRHGGTELALTLPLTPAWSLKGSATYARHVYASSRPVNSRANPTEAIRSGDDIDTAPRTLVNALLTYAPNPKAKLALQWERVGRYFMDAANTKLYKGHNVVHLRTQYQLDSKVRFYGGVVNLTDRLYATRADYWFGNERYFLGARRTVYLGIEANF